MQLILDDLSLEQNSYSSNARNVNGTNGNCNNNTRSNSNSNNRVLAVSDFSQGFSLQEVYDAYFDCRKHKRWTWESIEFELEDWIKGVNRLHYEINNRTYEIGRSSCFIIHFPKTREVFAANFRDRIVHHLIINALEPYFEKYLIQSCYSCRKNKGTLYGQLDFFNKIKQASNNYTKDCYISKFDCTAYFMSIDKEILWNKLQIFINNNYFVSNKDLLLWLVEKVIFNDPTKNCILKSDKSQWNLLPKSKSLFYIDRNKGLPIGNFTSQWFGNFYLTDFDIWASSQFLFGRYVDDIVSIQYNKKEYKKFYKESREFLKEYNKIILNPNKIYVQYYSKGVNFIGSVLKNNRIYVSNNILSNFYNKLYNFQYESISSYYGMFKHYNSKHIIIRIINETRERNLHS